MKYMLDATALRNIAARDTGAIKIMFRMALVGFGKIGISAIAAAEIHKAIDNHKLTRFERGLLESWLNLFKIMPFDAAAAETAGRLAAKHGRGGRTTPKPDYLIAGHAVQLGCVLVTNNTRHFAGFPGLKLEDWTA